MYFEKIRQPAIGLNAFDFTESPDLKGEYSYRVPGRLYQMFRTYDVQMNDEPICMFGWVKSMAVVANVGRLEALVINCHGAPGVLNIGTCLDSENVHYFKIINKTFKEIYLTACEVAQGYYGKEFCQEMAIYSNSIVYAPDTLQEGEGGLPWRLKNKIDPFEGMVRTFYPDGIYEKSVRLSQKQ